jgi:thiol-disulfide isomerase/thioredoxin
MSVSKASDESASLPLPDLVARLTNETYNAFVSDRNFVTVVLFYASWHRRSVHLLREMEAVAERFRSEGVDGIRFAALHGPHYKDVCRRERIKSFPSLRVLVRGLVDKPHIYTGHLFNSDELYAFILGVFTTDKRQAAEEAEERRQEALKIPAVVNPTPGRVLQLTPDTYQSYRNSTNVLLFVLFYAPWCQHCKGPQETVKAVADYFHRDKTVIIGKLDCDAYAAFCTDTLNLDGYPTFMTVPKPSMAKSGSVYKGGHDAVDIYQHLDKQNQYFEAEGMEDIKKQFEKIRDMPRDQLPTDLSELGGVFAQFKQHNKDTDESRKPLGKKRASRS